MHDGEEVFAQHPLDDAGRRCGREVAGLAPKTNSERMGGSFASPSSAAPRRFMFTTRPGGGQSDQWWTAASSHLHVAAGAVGQAAAAACRTGP